ncbi:hypothetical protein [Moorena sp. SIO3I8]|uniref:hypothetical protein n=1 Tax=Moorena sp. SIO3I8 TaxID=2607833 RepID=UPI0025D0A4DC|nr:hypothetical protein [Moorena sp. SIO3I8]
MARFTTNTELHSKIVDWLDGEMGRWGDWEMGRWGNWEIGRWGNWEIGGRESCTFERNLV